jgi:hypothetical protein
MPPIDWDSLIGRIDHDDMNFTQPACIMLPARDRRYTGVPFDSIPFRYPGTNLEKLPLRINILFRLDSGMNTVSENRWEG